jgi:hypothetical protein
MKRCPRVAIAQDAKTKNGSIPSKVKGKFDPQNPCGGQSHRISCEAAQR